MAQRDGVSIGIASMVGEFAEDKDTAALLREGEIRQALAKGQRVTLDFKGVRVATQSFVHALVSDVLRTHGAKVLNLLAFKSCTAAVKGIIETVVQYSLESIEPDPSLSPSQGQQPEKTRKPRPKQK